MLKAKQIKFWKEKIKRYTRKVMLPKARFIFTKSIKRELMRKLIHLSSLWIPLLIYLVRDVYAFSVFFVMFMGDMLLEYGNYKRWGWARATYGRLFFKMRREKESRKTNFEIGGSIYVLLASMICVVFFAKEVAIVAISVMLISDTFAAVVGKLYGTRRLRKDKTMEGTVAFFISSLIVILLFNPIYKVTYAAIIACFAATAAELFEDKVKIDDNLLIPLTVGLILTFL